MSDDVDLAVAGDRGTRRYVRREMTITPAFLKGAALAKTVDFSVLSAEFDGEPVWFEPWLTLRLVERDSIISWGAYRLAFTAEGPDDSEPALPDVAWRRVEWDRLLDPGRFRAAPDKSAYVAGDMQIDSRIRFGRLAEQPRLAAAVREGIEVLKAGVPVVAMYRQDVAWDDLRVSVFSDAMVMNLDYAPRLARCGEVERWAERWSALVDSLDDTDTLAPDGDITVSYPPSYEDLIADVRRFPEPVVDPRLAGED